MPPKRPQTGAFWADALSIIARELPDLSAGDRVKILPDLQNVVAGMNRPSIKLRDLRDAVWQVTTEAFTEKYVEGSSLQGLRLHTIALLHDIIPPAHRFDWNWETDFGWVRWKALIKEGLDERKKLNGSKPPKKVVQPVPPGTAPVPRPGQHVQLPPQNAPPGPVGTIFVWGDKKPKGIVEDNVPQYLIDEAKKNGLPDGVVYVNDCLYTIVEKEIPGLPGRKTVESAAQALGYRSNSLFHKGYTRMANKVVGDIMKYHNSLEDYVKNHYSDLKSSTQAGLRAKYNDMLRSARTADLMIQDYHSNGKSAADLEANDIFEMHVSHLAIDDYVQRTGNHVAADYITGLSDFLLPQEAVKDGASFTNQMTKPRNNLRPQGTAAGGGKGAGGAAYVPMAERVCYVCGEKGHIGRDCPEKGKGKGQNQQQGATARARVVIKNEDKKKDE